MIYRLLASLHRHGSRVAAARMRHLSLVNGEDGLDLTQLVGGEAFIGLIAVPLDNAALLLDVDEGIAVKPMGMLIPHELVGQHHIVGSIGQAHIAGEGPQ